MTWQQHAQQQHSSCQTCLTHSPWRQAVQAEQQVVVRGLVAVKHTQLAGEGNTAGNTVRLAGGGSCACKLPHTLRSFKGLLVAHCAENSRQGVTEQLVRHADVSVLRSPAAALALCRCLRPPAAVALNTCQPPDQLSTALLPATHLANDLHSKLKLLLKRTRTPAGLMGPPAAPAGAGGSAGGLFPAVIAPAGPPCLEGVELQQFVCQVMVPLLPALQQHMAMALNAIKQPPQGGLDVLFEGGRTHFSHSTCPAHSLHGLLMAI